MNPNVDGGHDIGAVDDIGVDEGDGIYICVYVQYGDVDIYIMVKCLFVCHEKSTLPPGSLL